MTVTVGEHLVRVRMSEAGIHESAIDAFLASYRTLVSGATGLIPEGTIGALVDAPSLEALPGGVSATGWPAPLGAVLLVHAGVIVATGIAQNAESSAKAASGCARAHAALRGKRDGSGFSDPDGVRCQADESLPIRC